MAISQKAIAQAIKDYRGNVTRVAESFGVTRWAIDKRVGKSPTLKKVLQDARDSRNDSVRDVLYEEAVNNRNITAAIFIAKTQLGWVEKRAVDVTSDNKPLGGIRIYLPEKNPDAN